MLMDSHQTTCRVIYGDTDNMGFAYHGNYFRWFEIGRAELFRAWGMTYKSIEDRGIFLPISECYCKFTAPAKYDDMLVIDATLDEKVRGGVKFLYKIYRQETMELLAEGYTTHPCLDQKGRVVRPPEFIREVIARHA